MIDIPYKDILDWNIHIPWWDFFYIYTLLHGTFNVHLEVNIHNTRIHSEICWVVLTRVVVTWAIIKQRLKVEQEPPHSSWHKIPLLIIVLWYYNWCFLNDLGTKTQGILSFGDLTIRNPRYFVILFWASFHDFEEKISKKNIFFHIFFFGTFFWIFFF